MFFIENMTCLNPKYSWKTTYTAYENVLSLSKLTKTVSTLTEIFYL